MNTLQKLYDSEINWEISTPLDGGIDWQLNDEENDRKAGGWSQTLDGAIRALAQAAREHFPDSVFAKEAPGSTTCSTCLDGGCGEGGSCDGDCGDICAADDSEAARDAKEARA